MKLERCIGVFDKIKYHLFYVLLFCKPHLNTIIFHTTVTFSKTKEKEMNETQIYKMIL